MCEPGRGKSEICFFNKLSCPNAPGCDLKRKILGCFCRGVPGSVPELRPPPRYPNSGGVAAAATCVYEYMCNAQLDSCGWLQRRPGSGFTAVGLCCASCSPHGAHAAVARGGLGPGRSRRGPLPSCPTAVPSGRQSVPPQVMLPSYILN